MPPAGVTYKPHEEILSFEEILNIAEVFVNLGVKKIRLTGGEPLIRKDIIDLVNKLSQIHGLEELTMTTNGLLLKKYAKDLKAAGLSRINISIDSLDHKKYDLMTRGSSLTSVFEGIEAAKEVNLLPIKLNVVLIKDFNDSEIKDFVALTKDEKIDVRFIELMTLGHNITWTKKRFISNKKVLEKIPALKKVIKKEKSSPADYYQVKGYKGRVGLINPITCRFCSDCNRVRLTSAGKLKLCLHSDEEYDLRPFTGNQVKLKEYILELIKKKPKAHQLEEGKYINKDMHSIGG
jgi:cyclic pyranopterin phosphate synthase